MATISNRSINVLIVNVYYVMGFRSKLLYLYSTLVLVLYFTCTAHLCLLYKALMYIVFFQEIQYNLSVFLTYMNVKQEDMETQNRREKLPT